MGDVVKSADYFTSIDFAGLLNFPLNPHLNLDVAGDIAEV